MRSDATKRLIVLDSGLRAERGHHANFNRLLMREAVQRGWETMIIANREVSPHLKHEFNLFTHFSQSPYDRWCDDARCADIDNYIEQNLAFEQELRHLPIQDRAGDLLLVPTITHNQLLGLARWLTSDHGPRHARIVIVLLFAPGWPVLHTSYEIATALYAHALHVLAETPTEQIVLCAETEPIAQQFRPLSPHHVHVIPWPTAEPEILKRQHQPPSQHTGITIGYFGYAKAERGVHLLPAVVKQVLAQQPNTKFVVQLDTFLPETIADVQQCLQALGSRVQIHRGSFQRNRFLDVLAVCDALLLPYDPVAYRQRGSALFSEAAMLAKPMILPDQTWMADELARWNLGGCVYETWSSDAIANAALRMIEQHDALAAKSRDAAPRWTSQRTAGAYLDHLLQLYPSPRAVDMMH